MAEEDESWIFDSLVYFLNGPIWDAPLQSFIEEKSLIFEPSAENDEEYKMIFDEYKNLVDFMLGNFMEDIGISSEQFETACARGTLEGVSLQFQQNNFEQIWAANNYDMFKRMMAQRNVELQLQALELIEQKYGITPESFKPHKSSESEDGKCEETTVDINPLQSSRQFEKEVLQEIAKQFSPEDQDAEMQFLLQDKDLHESLKRNIEEHKQIRTNTPVEQTVNKKANVEVKDMAAIESTSSESTRMIESFKKQTSEVAGPELKKRQEYLRAQRDKLVALKKEARKKHLDVEKETVEKTRLRPKSARAAKQLLDGTETIEPQQLQLRKALVEKLKTEVMGNKYQ